VVPISNHLAKRAPVAQICSVAVPRNPDMLVLRSDPPPRPTRRTDRRIRPRWLIG
jgi:hypothetical protein